MTIDCWYLPVKSEDNESCIHTGVYMIMIWLTYNDWLTYVVSVEGTKAWYRLILFHKHFTTNPNTGAWTGPGRTDISKRLHSDL